jgi:orotate phosphoribosyltransferase
VSAVRGGAGSPRCASVDRYVQAMSNDAPPLDGARAALRDHVLTHSLRTGDFTLKSGAKSTWFLDTKQTACRPDGVLLMADVALSFIPRDADAIGGLTMGADPVAFGIAAVAATRGINLRSFSVRKESKDHGVTGRIAGALKEGDRVIITEDTATRGTSLMEAVDVVRSFGATPVLITVIVDRGGTAEAMAKAAGIPFVPMLTAPDLGYPFGS